MKRIGLLLITATVLTGCGREDGPPPSADPATTNTAPSSAATQAPLAGVVDPNMSSALKAFVREKGRLPQDMLELKNTKLDSVPRAPAGFVYAIDPVTVEVKLVKQ